MATGGRLAGRVAIVTGGASGIGLATTRLFVQEGARVMVVDRDGGRLDEVGAGLGEVVATCCADVTAEDEVAAAVAAAVDRFGRLDVLFANAGIGSMGPIVGIDAAEWMRVVEVNLLGPLLAVKHAAPRMGRGSSIVMTASLNAVQAARGMSAYCCSKAALAMLAEVAAMELGPQGIRVNAIGPGLVRTGLTDGLWMVPSIVGDFADNAPLVGDTSPEDIARLVTFLASDDASAVSGCLYLADRGGHTGRYPDLPARMAEAFGPGAS